MADSKNKSEFLIKYRKAKTEQSANDTVEPIKNGLVCRKSSTDWMSSAADCKIFVDDFSPKPRLANSTLSATDRIIFLIRKRVAQEEFSGTKS